LIVSSGQFFLILGLGKADFVCSREFGDGWDKKGDGDKTVDKVRDFFRWIIAKLRSLYGSLVSVLSVVY
jgi:hypothetical protein